MGSSRKGKLFCPVCGRTMVKAMTDPKTYRELDMIGKEIETVHVYYGCPNEKCATTVRLRFRKDGEMGDLYRMGRARRNAPDKLTSIGGLLESQG